MSAYATKKAEAFAKEVVKHFYQTSVADVIANRNYEGEIKDTGSIVNILTFDKITLKDYTGANMTADSLTESNAQLKTDQKKSYYFAIKDIDKLESYIKNPKDTVIEQLGKELKEVIDAYVLGFYGDVAAGNRVGTDYTTGTVTVDETTGAVTGSGTTFTAAMVGRGFKAAGHTKWYRVKTYTSATAIVIEDDLDDVASAYTGGAIAGGSAYVIEAATAVQATAATIYGQIVSLKTKLDKAKVPAADRQLTLPADIVNLLLQASALTPAVSTAYEDVVLKGIVGYVAGFKVIASEQVTGDGVNGYHCVASHKSWITMAEALTEVGIEEDLIGNFGKAPKGLFVYGAKVIDARRKAGAELFVKL